MSKPSNTSLYMERQKRKRELTYYLVSFFMMLLLTGLSFAAVAMKGIEKHFTAFFIVTLAVIQVAFQLYYFMHLKDKNHGMPALFIYSGAFVAFITVLAFVSIVWIS
ncbi:cytochrome c oxidase subunit 4 [Scopulibacillus daqui]|uniref:Cytochrome c oxidase subunit 4 n=2 Tax=Scopulibacillus daqui TaxID=1469162 RepID=A0ABS2PVZ5_9BACL|nr:cytochrome c oxidase subunit 4 [Scopulibacillus daqui]